MLALLYKFLFIVTITNGPVDITTCIGSFVYIPCGYSGTSIFPNWRITWISDDGSVVNVTFDESNFFFVGQYLDLRWIPDWTTGGNDAPNSVLRVGPVREFYDQSTYQCVFEVANNSDIDSTIGTLTVVGECAVYVCKYYSVPN